MSTIHPARSPRGDSRHSSVSATGSPRLAAYLAAGVGASMAGTPDAEAAVVAIDLTNLGSGFNITGTNGGVTYGTTRVISDWLGSGTGTMKLYNGSSLRFGLDGASGLQFAVDGTNQPATRLGVGAGTTIDGSLNFSDNGYYTVFRVVIPYGGTWSSPDLGPSPSQYMGFRFASGLGYKYGYLEVTWTASTTTFQILSGAFESTVDTAIAAGAPPTPVPAPSALALLALGGGAFRRARARAA
jgi:hypothetical protein